MGKILVLSNKPILKKKEIKALAKTDIQVQVVTRVDDELWPIASEGLDIIVVDDNLRGIDIFQVCRKLRGLSKAIIILLGNMPSWEMWEKYKDIGFDRYYRKPVKTRELISRLKLTLAKQGETVTEATETEKAATSARQESGEPPPASQLTTSVWHDPKVAALMGSLLSGKIKQLKPEINFHLADGFSYREADDIVGTSGKETTLILESLAQEGLLVKEGSEEILASPGGSFQLIPIEKCPHCDSAQLTRGQLIEHFNCGHIGLEAEFMKGQSQVCPKCQKELKLIGTDYRKPGLRYICGSCHGIFPNPTIKCRCLKTGEIFLLEELRHIWLYSYRLNEAHRQRLEFELEPKRQLIEYLKLLGYEVQESVQVQGRSGTAHTIDILASIDDQITKRKIAIGALAAPQHETEVSIDLLFSFDSKIYDTGIENKMVIAVPGLTPEAVKFARRQDIRVYTLEELRTFLFRKIVVIKGADRQGKLTSEPGSVPELARLGPKAWLRWLLEKKGYLVDEKVKLKGRSGTEHVLEFYAQKDDGISNQRLAATVIANEDNAENDVNEVIQFDTATYDVGIRNKVIISVHQLSSEAKRFAEYQRIKILEAKDLAEFSSQLLEMTGPGEKMNGNGSRSGVN